MERLYRSNNAGLDASGGDRHGSAPELETKAEESSKNRWTSLVELTLCVSHVAICSPEPKVFDVS